LEVARAAAEAKEEARQEREQAKREAEEAALRMERMQLDHRQNMAREVYLHLI